MTTSTINQTPELQALLTVRNLSVHFPVKQKSFWAPRRYLYAVDGVSFSLQRGHTLAIVGESGSGKTTTALAIARLIEATSGQVFLNGEDLLALDDKSLRRVRGKLQLIFQDPYSSLNPRLRACDIVAEPLRSLGTVAKADQQTQIEALFAAVGLRPEQLRLFPHQFSGGQRQRIGIARALAPDPDIIICDEPVSALDVAVQAQIINLLRALQQERRLTYLFISHDLGVVQHMCDQVAVMYAGNIVEHGDRAQLFNNPLHPYTRALLSAVPSVHRTKSGRTKRILIAGDPPNPIDRNPGCRFASRCPVAIDLCHRETPALKPLPSGQASACHRVDDDGRSPMD